MRCMQNGTMGKIANYMLFVSSIIITSGAKTGIRSQWTTRCASTGLCYGIPTLALQVYITVFFFIFMCLQARESTQRRADRSAQFTQNLALLGHKNIEGNEQT